MSVFICILGFVVCIFSTYTLVNQCSSPRSDVTGDMRYVNGVDSECTTSGTRIVPT